MASPGLFTSWHAGLETNCILQASDDLGIAVVVYRPLGHRFRTDAIDKGTNIDAADFRKKPASLYACHTLKISGVDGSGPPTAVNRTPVYFCVHPLTACEAFCIYKSAGCSRERGVLELACPLLCRAGQFHYS